MISRVLQSPYLYQLWQNYGYTGISYWLHSIGIGSVRPGEFHAEVSMEGWEFFPTWTVPSIFKLMLKGSPVLSQ
jgi:hypothetical protein